MELLKKPKFSLLCDSQWIKKAWKPLGSSLTSELNLQEILAGVLKIAKGSALESTLSEDILVRRHIAEQELGLEFEWVAKQPNNEDSDDINMVRKISL